MLPPKGQLLQVDGAVGTPCHVAGFGSKNASSRQLPVETLDYVHKIRERTSSITCDNSLKKV